MMMVIWLRLRCSYDQLKHVVLMQSHFRHIFQKPKYLKIPLRHLIVKESIYDLRKRGELTKKQHQLLKKYAHKIGITFISTPFSVEAEDLLDKIGVLFFKVGSGVQRQPLFPMDDN